MLLNNIIYKKNFAFIDGQNLYQSIKEQNWILDYRRFRVYLNDKYNISKAFIFIGYLPENQSLYTELKSCGYILKFKPVLHKDDHIKQGNVDADLVLNIMRYYNEYDKAVIISSDGDFDTTVSYLKRKSKLEIVLSPNFNKCSALLKIAAQDKIDFINNFKSKVEYKSISSVNEKAPLEDDTSRSALS